MKKVLIIAAIAAGAYFLLGNKKTDDTVSEVEANSDFFTKYNNQVIADSKGYWMLVKDGKLFSPESLETLQAWQRANPDKPGVIEVAESIWETLAPSNYGGSF